MWKVRGVKIDSAAEFFYQSEMEIREKRKIFVNCPVPEKFQRENYSGNEKHVESESHVE